MLKTCISIVILLGIAGWLGYPLVHSGRSSVDYDVVAETADRDRSFVIRDTKIGRAHV